MHYRTSGAEHIHTEVVRRQRYAPQDKAHNSAPKRVAVARCAYGDETYTVASLVDGRALYPTMQHFYYHAGPGPLEGWLDHDYQLALVLARWSGGTPVRADYAQRWPTASEYSKLC